MVRLRKNWDGLSLIHRGETSYINEPYVTGGNPILSSQDGVMFNDMLGNTLGVSDNGNFTKVNMTAFGETTATNHSSLSTNHFFTGKPYIGELGYTFLFRDYRPEQGKWQTADPLGYPDGWNNLAYVNNWVINCIDWLGGEVRVSQRSLGSPGHIVNHTWIDLTPDNSQDFSDNKNFNPSDDPNRNRSTISGMPDGKGGSSGSGSAGSGGSGSGVSAGDKLISDPNADINYPNSDSYIIIPTPAGMTDSEFIEKLLETQGNYDNQNPLPYAALPDGNTYNSNSFVAGLLNALGLDGTGLVESLFGAQPGAGHPVPTSRFE